jgi:geranylgeranyl transferase type-2 subunit beta
MHPDSYLQRLTSRLADGVARLPADLRDRHAAYLLAAQAPDGGWPGREGDGDLYYTGFALRGLAVLDALTPDACDRAAAFLRASLTKQTSVVDFFSFLYACLLVQTQGNDALADSPPDWPERVAATLETFATPDGGYNKSPFDPAKPTAGSTYHTFLVGLCYQLLGRGLPRPRAVADFVLSRRREDGGFVEVAPARRSGTNPTAAAVGLLQLVEPEVEALGGVREGVAAFLAEMAGDDGGLRANGRVPLSDLLSTFTAAWTLAQLGELGRVDGAAVARFGRECQRPEGGFHGGLWDPGHDVEYTFYGLGTLALFAGP